MKKIALALIACTLATPAVAADIDAAKLKPAKSTFATTLTKEAAVRCVRVTPPFDGMVINEVANDDGTVDIGTSLFGYRFALWSIKPQASGTVVEGRGQYGSNKAIIKRLRECFGVA